ncbi:J domain-containing protein [Niabella sp. CC-SYL272]|uniref:J domain-containing protein n=1 Tax=Niabella agricola TaxID=2891571 RepID=UPI001F226952|nr:J domain-containing protein [Niabella agricola]MCF3109586.1 J domain-containing protein [Niabella agricola]
MAKAKKGILDGYKTYDTSGGFGNAKQWREAFRERFSKKEAEEVLQGQELTPYQILGVSPNASQADVKKAFRGLIAEWHPDHNQHRIAEAEEMSKKILAAYSLLTH